MAAKHGHLSVVVFLVSQIDCSYKQPEDSLTPLHFAAEKGHLNVVEYLVNQKADVNTLAMNSDCDGTPLHYASKNGHLRVVEYLIDKGADIDAFTMGNRPETPLHLAA